MQTLSVSGAPTDSSFDLGELKMAQADELGFLPGTWVPLDKYCRFSISMIRLSIENLILNDVIQISWGVVQKRFLFFKTTQFVDMAICNKPALENKQFGLLESCIIRQIQGNPKMTMEAHVRALLDQILPKSSYGNPGKKLFTSIVLKNEFQYWNCNVESKWFIETVSVEISDQQKEAMINALNKTCLPILDERKYNRAFSEFSDRLQEYVESAFNDKISSSD